MIKDQPRVIEQLNAAVAEIDLALAKR